MPGSFPRRFDAYVLLKPLARGGMGQLYLAMAGAPGLEKPCVIKQVPPDVVAAENARRFRDEAMVALRLNHGNLVSVFDAGINDGQIFLAMEYVDGRDLHAVWNRCAERRVPFPVDISVYIVKELARGLAYAHAFEHLDLVHRDVSPANVLLSFSGEVKLTDFGLATSTLKLERTAPGIVYGKVSYLAPEQARRERLDGRADIYAAGILLWELLTGRPLFPIGRDSGDEASTPSEANANALYRARHPEVPPPSSVASRVPPALDRIVMRALAPEREDRYPDGESLRADLASFLAETAPKTDAARLSEFLRPLYADDVRTERVERDRLMTEAARLLTSPIAAHAALSPSAPASAPGPRASDPRVGSTIGGRYFVRRLCGEGAMGRVYEAHHIDIGRRVAIKVLHASFHGSADLVERFRREARAASRIGHANIVDVTDSGTTSDGAFYFVMEFLDGMNLEQLIADAGPLPVPRALLITAQIARALEAAHAADIIHRDLKPANVMLVNRKEEEDFVKVLDFGISKDLDAAAEAGGGLTRPNVAIGTPVYMAPEQAAGRPAGPLTDVYAVGGLLYEMLTGQPPCSGDDAMAVLAHKATHDPPPARSLRPELPAAIDRLLARALARNPANRQPSMTVLKEDVLSSLTAAEEDDAPVLALPFPRNPPAPVGAPTTARLRRLVPRSRVVILGGGLALAVGLLLRLRPEPTPPVAVQAPAASPAPAAFAPSPASPPPGRNDAVGRRTPAARRVAATELLPSNVQDDLAVTPPAEVRLEPAPHREPARLREPLLAGAAPRPTKASSAKTAALLGKGSSRDGRDVEAGVQAGVQALLGRGQRAFDWGDYPGAIRWGRQAIAAGAGAGGHLLVGDAYYHLDRFDDARREYEAALDLDPTDAAARRRLELARRAAAH